MSKQRNLRKKRAWEDQEDAADAAQQQQQQPGGGGGEGEVRSQLLADLKLLQRQRRRIAGVDTTKLVPAAAAADDEDEAADNELMDAQYVKAEGTNKSQILEEKEHMERYVEQELAARLGKSVDEREAKLSKAELQERELYQIPEGFETSLTKEVSLPGMMTAITEVEVSKEAKMKKIEETEAIKHAMLLKKTGRPQQAPSEGMAVRRGMFAFSFGQQQRKQVELDPAQVIKARRYITQHSVDPVEAAKRAARKAAHGGRQ